MTTIKVGGKKKCVRGWLNKRSTVAIVEALKRKGYDRHGTWLAGNQDGRQNLQGSAMLVVSSPVLHMDYKTLSEQADKVVAQLEKYRRVAKNASATSKAPVQWRRT